MTHEGQTFWHRLNRALFHRGLSAEPDEESLYTGSAFKVGRVNPSQIPGYGKDVDRARQIREAGGGVFAREGQKQARGPRRELGRWLFKHHF